MHLSTVVYCFLSAGVGVAASLAYFRGVELPRRIKRYGKDRMGGGRGGVCVSGGGGDEWVWAWEEGLKTTRNFNFLKRGDCMDMVIACIYPLRLGMISMKL